MALAQHLVDDLHRQLGAGAARVRVANQALCGYNFGCMDTQRIARLTVRRRYEFSNHAERERIHDRFTVTDVKGVALRGKLLEDYPEDPRGHSCLMLGWAVDGRPIHAVLTILSTDVVRFITVYEPTWPKWSDARTRGERL